MAFQIGRVCLMSLRMFSQKRRSTDHEDFNSCYRGLNNPEACYQSLNVTLFRQVSSSNRISHRSIFIIF